jgi:hypothetical protein
VPAGVHRASGVNRLDNPKLAGARRIGITANNGSDVKGGDFIFGVHIFVFVSFLLARGCRLPVNEFARLPKKRKHFFALF